MTLAPLATGDRPSAPDGIPEPLAVALRRHARLVVGFSGGADSAFLAASATAVMGADRVLCATAVSPSLAPEELDDCRALAGEWGLRHVEVATAELEDPDYRANAGDRCWHCKHHLMAALGPLARDTGAVVALGVNLDDLGEHRPGQTAAAEAGAVFPLVEAQMTKAAVRAASASLGLRTWDKPAAACLASRVPYGTPVTIGTLGMVARAESGLRALGLRQVRVRHSGELARIEVPEDDLAGLVARRHAAIAAVRSAGYRYVTLDLEGFRSGNLNAALAEVAPASGTRPLPEAGR
jgi:uncharacterized protein